MKIRDICEHLLHLYKSKRLYFAWYTGVSRTLQHLCRPIISQVKIKYIWLKRLNNMLISFGVIVGIFEKKPVTAPLVVRGSHLWWCLLNSTSIWWTHFFWSSDLQFSSLAGWHRAMATFSFKHSKHFLEPDLYTGAWHTIDHLMV